MLYVLYETYVNSFRIGLEFTLHTKDDFNTPVPEAADTHEGSLYKVVKQFLLFILHRSPLTLFNSIFIGCNIQHFILSLDQTLALILRYAKTTIDHLECHHACVHPKSARKGEVLKEPGIELCRPKHVDSRAGPADSGSIGTNLRREGFCQEQLDNRHVADRAEGVEEDDREDGNPSVIVVLILLRLDEVVVGGVPKLGGGHQGGADKEERLARTNPEKESLA